VSQSGHPLHCDERGVGVEVGETERGGRTGKVKGYLSYETNLVYLVSFPFSGEWVFTVNVWADAYDHMDYVLASLDIRICLLNYGFNVRFSLLLLLFILSLLGVVA
jgi:hypothetical protein